MISSDLLNQLREKDPYTYARYMEYTREFCHAVDPRAEWILQAIIQEAIRARAGWGYQITSFGLPVIANVYNRREYTTGRGDTEAEALCRAYLAAIGGPQ